ncbi:ABC transporter permease [Microbacterium amylolyticum]|uniref:ABC-type lipoprotein release transport system permease subunit n=1 Tax=Microbacterium amylolyticum TaxID=936337 RepID=A0ABS4ZH18_9MICO|nr:ABC transporter permease [Microbacterium amylolyticum]MBP2436502.1 ABC-type lipoprotein release transport system permease subunit [Microbacterium amylolyticum]
MTIAPPRPTAAARRDARSAASGRSGGSWRVSLRLAMRQVRRSWATSLLVVVLILLPISGATGVLVFAESNRLSTAMTIDTEIGSADAALEIVGGPDPTRTQYLDDPFWTRVDQGDDGWPIHAEQEPPESAEGFVPDGAQVMSITGGMVDVETEHGRAQVDAEEGAAWDPLVRGRYLILDGRAPTNDSEAMVTPAMLERLGAEIGDTLTVIDPAAQLTIVGTLTLRMSGDVPTIFAADGALNIAENADEETWISQRWFVDGWNPSASDVAELNRAGLIVFDRHLMANPGDAASPLFDRSSGSEWAVFGVIAAAFVFASYIVVLISSAALTVTARRQHRTLAVVASVGADPRALRSIVLLQGILLGAVGGVLGVLAGIGGGVILHHATAAEVVPLPVRIPWLMIMVVVIAAVLVGSLTAYLPARQAAKMDVLAGLRGTRRPVRIAAQRPLWGLVILLIGVLLAVISIVGLVLAYRGLRGDTQTVVFILCLGGLVLGPLLAQIGVIVAGHWILARLSSLWSRAGVAPRIAGRDAVANPGRIVPAFGAIAACAFLATSAFGGAAVLIDDARSQWSPQAPEHGVAAYLWADGSSLEAYRQASEETSQALSDAGAESIAVVREAGSDDTSFVAPMMSAPPRCDNVLSGMSWDNAGIMCVGEEHAEAGKHGNTVVVSAAHLSTLFGTEIDADVLDAFEEGGAIVTDPAWATADGRLIMNRWVWDDEAGVDESTVVGDVPVSLIEIGPPSWPLQVVLSPRAAQELGIETLPRRLVADMGGPVSASTSDALTLEATRIGERVSGASSVSVSINVQEAPPAPGVWMWLILGLVGVLVIAVSTVALGLARVERRPDDATLASVGASRRTRRTVSGAQGLLIAGVGCITGVLAGLIPVTGVVTILGAVDYSDFGLSELPWAFFGLVGFVLPCVIALVMWLIPPGQADTTRRTAIA